MTLVCNFDQTETVLQGWTIYIFVWTLKYFRYFTQLNDAQLYWKYYWNCSNNYKLELDSTMSQSWIEFWNCILNLTQNNLSWLFKSTVKIWVKLNIRNLVKNYPILQVRSWICGGQGSWFVLISFSLGQVSLLWKFELRKFMWVNKSFWLWTWTWIVTISNALKMINFDWTRIVLQSRNIILY